MLAKRTMCNGATVATAKSRLPIGIQTFRKIREGGRYYADKTAHIGRLIDDGQNFFLSRPRRFGKSLLLDTIKELFEGSEELFRGLAIHDDWDWSQRHPVVRLDFGQRGFTSPDSVELNVTAQLAEAEREAGVASTVTTAPERFGLLLRALHERTGKRVVVLVDEYDKPILDALGTPEVVRANRDYLHGLYSAIKSADAHVHFAFLTGVSKFSKVSLFSGLNNLIDITLDPEYATICGYTESDLDTVFAPAMEGFDRDKVREWYNGYSWYGEPSANTNGAPVASDEERVYNPYDILKLCRRRRFGAWWFETATPTFLVETLARRGIATFELDGMPANDALLSSFDVDEIAVEALLFQTGYLTVSRVTDLDDRLFYTLGYPNREVRQSLNEALLAHLAGAPRTQATGRLLRCFMAHDLAGLESEFRAIFAGIPTDWHRKNDIGRFEGYYASVFYSGLAALGMDLRVEDASSAGRLDLALRFAGHVYLFEFKVSERPTDGAALKQILERGYADKYRNLGEPIHLVGVEFSTVEHEISRFDVALAT